MNSIKDKIKGSLLGGAIGDALGYPVEFLTYDKIINKYGKSGITRYELDKKGIAEISDDTQMTLFTANGLLFGFSRGATRGIMARPTDYIRDSFLEWLQTQTGDIDYTKPHFNWIREIKELHSFRAPGNTCMQALKEILLGHKVENNSKGCGGVMRIAPIPLFFSSKENASSQEMMRMAGDSAAITHKHPLGYLPAALLAHLIYHLVSTDFPSNYQIATILNNGISLLNKIYPEDSSHILVLKDLLRKATRHAVSTLSDTEAIQDIGEGWVAEETLAIALFCVMRYPNDFEKAVVAAVNHSGDSDSTGAVTGNLSGAIVGYDAFPDYYKENLELRWLLEEMAEDLSLPGIPVGEYSDNYDTPEKRRWMNKYVEGVWKDKVPIRNSYLVNRKLNLYAGEYPGDKDDEMCKLKVSDIGTWGSFSHFFDLTEEGELKSYNQFLNPNQHHHRFPVRDVGVPQNTSSVRRLIEEIIHLGEQGSGAYGKVYIHCRGGVGRTGTIVGCLYAYLLKEAALTAEELYIEATRRLTESFSKCPKSKYRSTPETEEQKHFIRLFIERECL